MRKSTLSKDEEDVIIHKQTEPPFTGVYDNFFKEESYVCRQCESPLYISTAKFHSGCGWPSFDQEIQGGVDRIADSDGRRVEIVCAKCKGHLGHVFEGERFTSKNTRHCVNSLSLKFIPNNEIK